MPLRSLALLLSLALLVAACGDGGGDDLYPPEGVWAGEASAMRTGRPIALCLELENFQATAPPERFSGALYVDGVRHDLVSGTWGPGDVIAFSADSRSFTGVVAVERLYGSWRTYGPATGNSGGWTLDRTDEGSCD